MADQELRLVITAPDFDAALAFYRDGLGLAQEADWSDDGGRVVLLSAGRATIEINDERHAETIDRLEVGRRVAPHHRVAFAVADSTGLAERLQEYGSVPIAGPARTPWGDINVRLEAPDGTQLTLFSSATDQRAGLT